ncbi:arylacetamide deacetylase-like 3 [Hemicordylus capensis]|uniref:arylacetamide deacetylase-like 3 n=1 Tax=Hemicordylus capensis TaxID=884348 RepID=UPI002302AB4D|nr:arylacetamide deacetylase-like 3 [Hemicordylus capensis]XP_053137215.1 arylacetamide deacetylase-like 3 [Hemicordylus capensis]
MNGPALRDDPKLLIKDLHFDGVPVRLYHPKKPSVGTRRGMVYLHGGVGLLGSIQAYDRVCRYIARRSDTVVLCIEYRLSPENPYPVQLTDCRVAIIHFMKNAEHYGVDPNRISLCGDSSGGTFCALFCQELVTRADLPRLKGQILIYPFLQALDFNLPSYQQNHSVPILFKKRAIQFGMEFLGLNSKDADRLMINAHVPADIKMKFSKWISAENIPEEFKVRGYVKPQPAPFSETLYEKCKALIYEISPLIAEDAIIQQLPDTFLLTCEYDVVRDDGILYKKRLEEKGVPVSWYHDKNGFHGKQFLINYGFLEFPGTRKNMQRLIQFLEGL